MKQHLAYVNKISLQCLICSMMEKPGKHLGVKIHCRLKHIECLLILSKFNFKLRLISCILPRVPRPPDTL